MAQAKQKHPPREDDDDEELCPKNMTAEQARESKQLNRINDNDLPTVRPDEKLALEAKIFVALEAQENARRVEKEKELASVKLAPGVLEYFMSETRMDKHEAEKLLKINKGDLRIAMREFIQSFPQIELCRSNVLGL